MTGQIATALKDAPHDLGPWCLRELRRCMIDDADRTVGIIVSSGVAESAVPTVVQMRRTGETLVDRLDGGASVRSDLARGHRSGSPTGEGRIRR